MKPQLLLCESNPSSLAQLQKFLSDRGFDVVVASNGLECMSAWRALRPDVVMVDWETPWGGGDGVLSLLPEECFLPPVVISTSNLGSISRRLRYDGIVEVIHRPLRPKEAYAAILSALRRSDNVCDSVQTQPLVAAVVGAD